jgi:hypothetical protein
VCGDQAEIARGAYELRSAAVGLADPRTGFAALRRGDDGGDVAFADTKTGSGSPSTSSTRSPPALRSAI